MKTEFNTSRKDNLTSAALLAATFIAIVGGFVTSNDAHAVKVAPQMETQRMETIVVTAPRITPIARMETIVVTASRNTNILLASN
jgi:hypothetical protein